MNWSGPVNPLNELVWSGELTIDVNSDSFLSMNSLLEIEVNSMIRTTRSLTVAPCSYLSIV